MVDKSKMSVADILAAARRADGGGGEEAATPADSPAPPAAEAPAASAPAESTNAESTSAESAGGAQPAPKKSASGGRLSVEEMLAAARAEKSKPQPSAPAAQPQAEAKPAAKPKPAAAAKPAAKKPAAAAKPAEPRDTASILAAARKKSRPGPITKAEAAAKQKTDPKAKPKPKIVVPPMPKKPDYAKGKAARTKPKAEVDEDRRSFLGLGFFGLGIVGTIWTLAVVKFMFPNVLREPPSKFKVGLPDAFPAGQVQTKYKAQFGVWVVNYEYNGEQQLYALKSVCTHLGCTPNWLEAEQKFKCPCHGSGFYKDGINFEGPAPRPLERYAIRIADDGQIEIDKSRTFQEEMGQWEEPSSYIPV